MQAYLKLLLLLIVHVILCYGLLTNDHWFLIIIFGTLLYVPLHNFGPSIGYHRLFSHNSFKPKKWYPYLATFLSSISFFGDPLAYSLVHRVHHKYADKPGDPHSPKDGRFHAYIGWILKFNPTGRDKLMIMDIVKRYPWTTNFSKYEILVPIIFYTILFSISVTAGYIVLMASLLAFNSALYVNAFAHDIEDNPNEKHNATDNVFLAKWVMAIFMHKHHHNHGSLYDYSTEEFNDIWAKVIRKYLMVDSNQK